MAAVKCLHASWTNGTCDECGKKNRYNEKPIEMDGIEWWVTMPSPNSRDTGFDAGQRGWKLHAVNADGAALCGLRPAYGWGTDLFIERACMRCNDAVARLLEGKATDDR